MLSSGIKDNSCPFFFLLFLTSHKIQIIFFYSLVLDVVEYYSELKIEGGIEDNLKIIFLFLNENIYKMVLMMVHNDVKKELCGKLSLNYPFYPFLSGALIIHFNMVA